MSDESLRWALRKNTEHIHRIEQLLEQTMIAQATLDTALTNLTTAVNAAAAKLGTAGGATPSTPDTTVQAFVDGVTAQTVALEAAVNPPAKTEPAPAA